LMAPCLVYNSAMYTVYGLCGQYGRACSYTDQCGQCMVYTDPFEAIMLKADCKTIQAIGLHCVRSTAVGCVVEFRLWRLGTVRRPINLSRPMALAVL